MVRGGRKKPPGPRPRPPASRNRTRRPGWLRAATQGPPACGGPRGGDLVAATGGEGRESGVQLLTPCSGWASWALGEAGAVQGARCRPAPPGVQHPSDPPRWVLPPPSQPRGAGAASGRSSQTLRPRGPGHPVHVAPSHGKGTDASFAMKTAPLGLAGRELLARIPGPLLLQALQHPGGGRGGTGPSNKSPALAGARRPSPMRAPARGHPAGWGSAPAFWKAEPRPPGRINASWALSERRTPTAWEAHPEWPAPRGNFYWKVARCSSLYLGAGPPAASGSQPHQKKKFNGPSRHQPPPCPLAHPK